MRKLDRKGEIKRADKLFSLLVRQSHADFQGYVKCATCGKKMPWRESEAGHFVKRACFLLRWFLKNVHPQCSRCNKFLNGNEAMHARYIIKTYGVESFNEIMDLKDKWDQGWSVGIQEIREISKAALEALKNNNWETK